MTTITLPPDLEGRIAEEARRRGTSPELLVLDGLRQQFAPELPANGTTGSETLFDFLAGYVGTVAGSTEPYSEDCGRRFEAGLAEKQQRERP
jgi:hypothetical protein